MKREKARKGGHPTQHSEEPSHPVFFSHPGSHTFPEVCFRRRSAGLRRLLPGSSQGVSSIIHVPECHYQDRDKL